MLQKMRVLLLVCITVVLAACGGGGGSDEAPNFAGTYQLSTAVVSSNTCGTSVANIAGGQVGVTQNGRNLTWVEAGGSYPGTVDADNGGFTVTTSQSGVLITVDMRSGGGNAYSAKLTATGACTIVWTGTAVKTS
ncbi:MAG: hypothetical protein RL761_755 [Pseudomonadota bacterium]|jgi:hypothetical protein